MRPLTLHTPKPLLSFAGKTALEHLFLALPKEIDEVIIVVKYLEEQIRRYCGSQFLGRSVSYRKGSSEGNALGLLNARDAFGANERFALAYGDEFITSSEVAECLTLRYSWLCYTVPDPTSVGIATLDDKGYIRDVIEKPKHSSSNLAADGFMVIDASIFSYQPERHGNGEYYISDLMKQFIAEHDVRAAIGSKYHGQLGTPADLERLEKRYYEMIKEEQNA